MPIESPNKVDPLINKRCLAESHKQAIADHVERYIHAGKEASLDLLFLYVEKLLNSEVQK